jgi:hypothetical protein
MEDDSISSVLLFVPIILFLLIVNAAGLITIDSGAEFFAVVFAAIISAVVGMIGVGTILSKFI